MDLIMLNTEGQGTSIGGYNFQAEGSVASRLLNSGMDPNILRPWIGRDGRQYVTQNRRVKVKDPKTGEISVRMRAVGVPVANANATLQRLEWTELDRAVTRAALPRLKAVADLRGRGLVYNIQDGMGTTVLQTQRMSDMNAATISMDPAAESASDRPVFDLSSLPLPVVHKDFHYTARQIATSRKMGLGLDTTAAEVAGRRVAEGLEQLLLGVGPTYQYGGGTAYGYTNWTGRITKSMTLPTGSNASTTINEVLNMRQLAYNQFHFGPFVLYVSPLWAQFLDNDYILTGGNVATQTLRQRLMAIEAIEDVMTLDYLAGYDMVLVQLTPDITRLVIGMDVTTLQWEVKGGLEIHFKVMAIMVPQVRGDFNGNTGIVHGTVSGHTETPLGAQYLPLGNP